MNIRKSPFYAFVVMNVGITKNDNQAFARRVFDAPFFAEFPGLFAVLNEWMKCLFHFPSLMHIVEWSPMILFMWPDQTRKSKWMVRQGVE